MQAWRAREGSNVKIATARSTDALRAALLRTYDEAEHARGCAFWQGHECNCFLEDVARALGRDRRV
jgi:hypothetical protein